MDRLVLALLGGFRARLESGPSVVVPTKKGQALLAYLACSPLECHQRDALATLLWGEMPQAHARHSLRQTLFVLRAALPESASAILHSNADTIALDRGGLVVDMVDFERLAREGTVQSLQQATTLHCGDLLAGIAIGDQPFEEWLRAERERLHELALEVLAKLLALQCAAGSTQHAIQSAIRLLALDPLQEPVYRTLMRLYVGAGRPGAALRQYQTCVNTLQRELGLEPETETTQLLHELVPRRVRPSPPTGRLPIHRSSRHDGAGAPLPLSR
jgi:DNA-binding SARP family transcriptional activator